MTVPTLESNLWRTVVPTNLIDFDISRHTLPDESPTSVLTQQNTHTINKNCFETTHFDDVPNDEYDTMQDYDGDMIGGSSRDQKSMNDIREDVDIQDDETDDQVSFALEESVQSTKKVRIASQWVHDPVMDDDSSTVIILTPPSCDEYKQEQQNKNDTSTYMKQNRRDRNLKDDVTSYETTVKTTTYTPTSKFVTSLKDFGRSLPLTTTDFFNNPKNNNNNQGNCTSHRSSNEMQHVQHEDDEDGYDMKFGFQQAMESIDTSSFLQAITVCGVNMECVGTVSDKIDNTFGQKVREHINRKMETKTRPIETTSVSERESNPKSAVDRHVPITSPTYKETKYVTDSTRYKDDDDSWLEPSPSNDNDDDFWEDQQIRRLGSWATYATAGTEVTFATAGTEVTDETVSLMPSSSHSIETTLTPYTHQSNGGGDSVGGDRYRNSKYDNNMTTSSMHTLYDDEGNPIDPKLMSRRRKKAVEKLKDIQHSNNRRKKISFAYPPISSMKICPRIEPEEIQKLFYTEEELDMYEQDRRSTITVDDVEIVAISQSMDDEIDAISGKETTTTTTKPPNTNDKNLSTNKNNNNSNNRNSNSSAADISKTDKIAAAAVAEQVTPPRQNLKEKTKTTTTTAATTTNTSSSSKAKHELVQTKQETIVTSCPTPLPPPSIPRTGKNVSNNKTKQVKYGNDTENRINNSNTITNSTSINSLSSLTALIPRPKLRKNVTTGSLAETTTSATADDSVAASSSDNTQKQHRTRYGTPILFRQRCGGPEQKLFGIGTANRNVFQRLTESRQDSNKKQISKTSNNNKTTTPVKGSRFVSNLIPSTRPSTPVRSSKTSSSTSKSTPTTVMTLKQTNDNNTIQETVSSLSTPPHFDSQEQSATASPQSSSSPPLPPTSSSSTSPQSSSSSRPSPNNDDDEILEEVEEATTKKNKRLLKSVQIYLRERSTGAV